jgi:hypothetical protein
MSRLLPHHTRSGTGQPAEAQSLSWLWQERLALGKLAILDGDPSLGKSLVALDLCARLSTGRPLPDGSAGPGPACAVVFNAEDDSDDTIAPRLRALGADLERAPRRGSRSSCWGSSVATGWTAGHCSPDRLQSLSRQEASLEFDRKRISLAPLPGRQKIRGQKGEGETVSSSS